MRKVLVRFISLALLFVFVLAALPTGNAVDEAENNAAPQLVKGSKWSQSAEVDFSGFFDTMDIDGLVDEMVGELKSEGIVDKLDVDLDIDGGMGMFMTTEVVDVGVETNGEQCNHIRTSTYFGSGLGVDLNADFSGDGITADGSGSAGYYFEFDLIVDTWVTVDELALVKVDMTLKPDFKAEVDAEAKGSFLNTKFDIDINGYVKTKDVVAKLELDFDEPFDYLDLPIEDNEEWTAEGSFSGKASITGKIEMKLDVTGIPGQKDQHEEETIDLGKESEGPQDFEEEISLTFESGASTTTTLPDGSKTPVIPVSNVDLMDIFDMAYEDDYYDEGVSIMHFTVEDGNNRDDEHGCFFLIRAGRGVDIDPKRHAFFVAEKGYSPKKLDVNFREYRDSAPYGPEPESGDMNSTYDWTEEGYLWSDGEYIGFDMPMDNLGIDPTDGKVYEVLIKNPYGEVVFKDTFVYSAQYWYRSRSDDDYAVIVGPFVDDYGDSISGIMVSFELNGLMYQSATGSDGTAFFEIPESKIPDDTMVTAEKDYTEITWKWGVDSPPYNGNFIGDDDYYYDDYYYEEEESFFPYLPFLEDLEDFDPEDFEMKHYFAPELGVFVKSEMGMNEIALQNIDNPEAKKALSSLNMEMKPATEKEVESFKSSRSKDYFVKADDGPGTNWVLVGLGILAAVVVLVFVLMIVMRRKNRQRKSPPSGDHGHGFDPYQTPPPPEDHEMDSPRRRFPPPPEY